MNQNIESVHKTKTLTIRFKPLVLARLNDYANSYFKGNRSKACNRLLETIFDNGGLLLYVNLE